MIIALLITFNYQIDIVILRGLVSFEEVGYYSVGVGLATLVWVIPNAFKEVLFYKTTRSDSIDDIRLSIKLNIYISLVVFVIALFFGKIAIKILYGMEFIASYGVTSVIFLGMIPMIFYKMISPLYIANGKYKQMFRILIVSAIINIAINYMIVPYMGIIGAALASVFSYTVCGATFVYIFMRDYNIRIGQLLVISKDERFRLVNVLNKNNKRL
jgi:O-antigen/teichoic acid export membrane protein